jgi:hypothetical protein
LECIADGLGFNSALLNIDLTRCVLGDVGVSILAQTLGSRNTTLRKLTSKVIVITSTGVGVLLETREHSSHITDLELDTTYMNEGASSSQFFGRTRCQSLRASLVIALFMMMVYRAVSALEQKRFLVEN